MMWIRVSSPLLLLLLSIITPSSGADWCYQIQQSCDSHCKGPEKWQEVNEACGRTRQSPINIITRKTKLDPRLSPLKFGGYQEVFSASLKNNGHSVTVTLPHRATVSGGNLGATYRAVQFHFHWGDNGGPGSEHTVDGEQYPMELHIVHMRDNFRSLEDALRDPLGVAVLGFFYEESRSLNRKYEGFIQGLKNVEEYNANTTIRDISLSSLILMEENMTSYYRYNGSLTTPGCTESVVWTVFHHPIPLSRDQLSAFSNLKFYDGSSMVKTFRPVQPLWTRTVYRSSGAPLLTGFSLTLLLSVVSMLTVH